MILRNEDRITIETYDKNKIEKLKRNGFVSIYEDMVPIKGKKKASTVKRSTRGIKAKQSIS